jgi:16S rRNA (cytosine1402-N4)-methyltransferase
MTAAPVHIPVMLGEVVAALAPRAGGVYVDGTFGAGGYARAILESADCQVWGIDRDAAAIARADSLMATFPDRLKVVEGRFGNMETLLNERGVDAADGVALDLGVSSPQIDDPARGFSFRADGPLDMRMGHDGATAADVVNTASETELANIAYHYGEERLSRRVARAIVAARSQAPITGTLQLADIIRSVVPRARDGIDPATRTFQALRIHVNDEIGELKRGLSAAERMLRPGGRLAVVAFHSLEDRVVKTFLKERSGAPSAPSRHSPAGPATATAPSFHLLTKKSQVPTATEAATNPRARSARLRAAERTTAPAFPAPEKEAA